MNAFQRWTMTLAAASVLTSCGGPGAQEEADTNDEVGAENTPMPSMSGMERMQDPGMMDEMQGHMQMMQGMDADSMMGMVPEHRPMVANMLSQMNRDMRDMGMATDSVWDATVDSLRDDLTGMAEMNSAELDSFMPEHKQRVMRLMEMHREMMQGMNR